jgi:hypothetical protein
VISGLTDDLRASSSEFADNQVPPPDEADADFITARSQNLNQSPALVNC